MNTLNRVTLTGADDSIYLAALVDLSDEFPFVEWGILVSQSQMGRPRFPSLGWISQLNDVLTAHPSMIVSLHVCGRWVREICKGNWSPFVSSVGPIVDVARRVQLNFHAYAHLLSPGFTAEAIRAAEVPGWQIIFQCDAVNDHLASNAYDDGLDAVPLYDRSGGAGIVPGEWPVAMTGIYSGYAGGLGPDNLCNQIPKIEAAARGPHWIDMETKIRSPDDRQFDLAACRIVLEYLAPLIAETTAT